MAKSIFEMNDSVIIIIIIIPHIQVHTYRKKTLTLKYTNIWIFKSSAKIPHKSLLSFLEEMKIDSRS